MGLKTRERVVGEIQNLPHHSKNDWPDQIKSDPGFPPLDDVSDHEQELHVERLLKFALFKQFLARPQPAVVR